MKVQAIKSFIDLVGDRKYRISQGQEFELPEGCEHWLNVGFVVPAREHDIGTAVIEPKEKAVTRGKTKKAVDKVMRLGKKK